MPRRKGAIIFVSTDADAGPEETGVVQDLSWMLLLVAVYSEAFPGATSCHKSAPQTIISSQWSKRCTYPSGANCEESRRVAEDRG